MGSKDKPSCLLTPLKGLLHIYIAQVSRKEIGPLPLPQISSTLGTLNILCLKPLFS